jgi:hypothetical protein
MRIRAVAAVLACIAVAPATAGHSVDAPTADRWDSTVAPYLWAAGIEESTGTLPGLPPLDVDMSFGDIFDDLQPSGMVFFSANKGRLVLAADLQYVQTEAKSKALEPLFGHERLNSTSLVLSELVDYLVLGDATGVSFAF